MPLLLYCITRSGSATTGAGVGGLPVLSCEHAGIAALFSKALSSHVWTAGPLAQAVKEFHHVVQQVFQGGAIIPFRFPTVMQDEEELTTHMREQAPNYAEQLRKFEGLAQMELLITKSEQADEQRNSSGTEYLKARQTRLEQFESVAKDIQLRTAGLAQEWHTRTANQAFRLFGLVTRDAVLPFRASLESVSIPAGLAVRVSGPWPVTEFLDLN